MIRASLILGLSVSIVACQASAPQTISETTVVVPNAAAVSVILSEADVTTDVADWGSFLPYFTDDTHVLSPVLVGVAKIDAGQEVHPAHRHADEEYLMVTKGRGVWSLNGVQRPATEGDILFARAWDYHGIRAADDSPLEFVVFKYSGRGLDDPTDPDPSLPEERPDPEVRAD